MLVIFAVSLPVPAGTYSNLSVDTKRLYFMARETGRAAIGVKLIDLEPGDKVVAVAKLQERMEDVESGDAESPPEPPAGPETEQP